MKLNVYHQSILVVAYMLAASTAIAQTCNTNIPITKPDSRYVDNGNGTITDTLTNLMWMQCPHGLGTTNTACDTGSAATYSWQDALAEVKDVNNNSFAGYSDWRMPNIKELKSLVELACHKPSINSAFFPVILTTTWSSSPSALDSDHVWVVAFGNGADASSLKNNPWGIRLVRSSQ